MNTPPKIELYGHYQATVELLQGPRQICDFIASAGMGVTGVGVHEKIVIDYKPGEIVDKKRVLDALEKMQKASDEEDTPFKILSYKLISLIVVPDSHPTEEI